MNELETRGQWMITNKRNRTTGKFTTPVVIRCVFTWPECLLKPKMALLQIFTVLQCMSSGHSAVKFAERALLRSPFSSDYIEFLKME